MYPLIPPSDPQAPCPSRITFLSLFVILAGASATDLDLVFPYSMLFFRLRFSSLTNLVLLAIRSENTQRGSNLRRSCSPSCFSRIGTLELSTLVAKVLSIVASSDFACVHSSAQPATALQVAAQP